LALVHAGLPPQWTLDAAMQQARAAEQAIRQTSGNEFFDHMYGDTPDTWDGLLAGNDRLRFTVNCCTRMRYVDRAGRLYLNEKGAPGTQAPGLVPWFDAPGRLSRDTRIVFGHWSTLGVCVRPDVVALDSGCLWGRQLTAARLDTDPVTLISVSCAQSMQPSGHP
jgi:bis(5'-nucleosyl)-tetraphosphatase (symmetrical)